MSKDKLEETPIKLEDKEGGDSPRLVISKDNQEETPNRIEDKEGGDSPKLIMSKDSQADIAPPAPAEEGGKINSVTDQPLSLSDHGPVTEWV